MSETEDNKIPRNSKGQFPRGVSGNPLGRTKGAKGKHSKAKLDSMLNLAGPTSLKKLQEIAEKYELKGDLGGAMRIHVFIAGKWMELLIHNEKIELQKAKESDVKELENTPAEEYQGVVVKFGTVS